MSTADYDTQFMKLSTYLPPGHTGRIAEKAYRTIFIYAILGSTHLLGTSHSASRAWTRYLQRVPPAWNLQSSTGLLYDSLFLEVANSQPSVEWYTKLLAARNTLYVNWIANLKTHTQCGTHIITLLCNVLGIMDLRFLSLKTRANYNRLTRPLPIEVPEILTRPPIKLHIGRLPDVYNFIAVQVLC